MTALICVGMIAGAFGVRGEVRVKSFCANPSDLETYAPLLTEEGDQSFDISLIGQIKNGFSARIVGVVSKDDADALRGISLFARREDLPALPNDEYYYSDLIGLQVADTGGAVIGHVKPVMNHGADDLLEVAVPGASDTALIPFTKVIVPTVDLTSRRIVIDPPEGLL
jgi:16S rRNA processing protein RimM